MFKCFKFPDRSNKKSGSLVSFRLKLFAKGLLFTSQQSRRTTVVKVDQIIS